MTKKKNILLIIIFSSFAVSSQVSISEDLKKIPGISFTKKENSNFKEYYEIFVDQPVDHFGSGKKKFRQRIFLGFNEKTDETVMETDGYSIEYAGLSDFIDEPCKLLKGNMIVVEQRYFGKSVPDTLDWNFLTMKQVAYDNHKIRKLFAKIFSGKWVTTGISKGGQNAIAYKMYFPNDASATIVYGTGIKKQQNDSRITNFLSSDSKTDCRKKISAFQQFAFRNKKSLLPEFEKYTAAENLTFDKMNTETVFDYVLLEYPFSFRQNCFQCELIPDTTSSASSIINELVSVVRPIFFSGKMRPRLEPSFYMFYHELGYYEYDLSPVKSRLKNDSYPNNIFLPENVKINFDTTYLSALNKFINDPKTSGLIFIYGEFDPWSALQPDLEKNKNCLKLTVRNGCHKSRFKDLDVDQKNKALILLKSLLK